MNFIDLNSGTSVAGDEIKAFYSQTQAKDYIYLIAGVHGDEVEGVYVLNKLIQWLREDDNLIEAPLVIVPILNVDGYRAGTRTNANGVDLNRNFPSKSWTANFSENKYCPGPSALSEPENKFLDKIFQKFSPKFILSFHSWKPLVNYDGDAKEIAEFLTSYNGYEINDDISYPTPGSLGQYAPEKYNCPIITFECPKLSGEVTLNDTWLQNEKSLKELFFSDYLK